MIRNIILIFVCFLLKTHVLNAQNGCTPDIPKHFDILVAYDQDCVTQLGGVTAARKRITENMDVAVSQLNTLFQQFNVTFEVVFFPDKIYPNNLDHLEVATQIGQDFICVPKHGVVFFQGYYAGGETMGLTSIINAGSISASLLVHELGHQVFGAGHTDSSVCSADCNSNFMESNFMCEVGDELEFTSCQIIFLNTVWFANGCPSLMRHIEPLPSNFQCPTLPKVSLTTDKKFLIRGCSKNRSDIMVNLTVTCGTAPATETKVQLDFQEKYYDFDLATMGIDFNAAQLLPPSNNSLQIKRLVNPAGPFNGAEQTFDLQPGESKTLMFKLKYNPDDSTDFIQGTIGGLGINAAIRTVINTPGIGGQNFSTTRTVTPKPIMPLANNALYIPNGDPVIITGNFIVPSNGTVGSNWRSPLTLIKPGGSIQVASGNKLNFPNTSTTTFEGCGGLWQGIQVNTAGTADIQNAVIMDAQKGVNMTATAGKVTVKNTIFENNEVGININGTSAGSAAVELSGLTFKQTAPLKVKPTAQVPNPNLFTLVGIQAEDAPNIALSTDDMLGYGGKFEGILNGIIGKNTNISVETSTFSNLVVQGVSTGVGIQTNLGAVTVDKSSFDVGRAGIRTVKGALTIKGSFMSNMLFEGINTNGTSLIANDNTISATKDGIVCLLGAANLKGNQIDNVTRGITTSSTLLTAESNKLTKVNRGIHASFCDNMVLRKNEIMAKDFGIVFFHQALAYNAAQLEENTITMEGNPDGVGIYTGGTTGISQYGAITGIPQYGGTLFNNTIHVKQGQSGITANVARSVELVYNHIDLAGNNSTAYGILLGGCDNLSVTDNDVTGSSTSNATAQRGIYGMHTCRSLVSCNYTDNTAYGFNFAGECSGKAPLAFQGNTMKNHDSGLLMGLPPSNGNAVIGPQVHHQNKWEGAYGGPGALHLGTAFNAAQSQFYADDQADNSYIPDLFLPLQWFINQTSDGTQYDCNYRPEKSKEEEYDIKIANGTVQGINEGGAIQWLAQRRLYERVMEEQFGLAANDVVGSFIAGAADNSIKDYADLQQSIRQINHVPTSDRQVLLQYDSVISQSMTEQQLLQAQLAKPALTDAQKRAIKGNIQLVQADLGVQIAGKDNFLSAIKEQRNKQVKQILANMPILSGTEVYKTNERTVYRIVLEQYTANDGVLSANQITDLENIAVQCPITGGDAVLQARLLLQQQSEAPIYYDDPAKCASTRTEGRFDAAMPILGTLKIAPVPADSYVQVDYNLEADKTLVVVDALGRICYQTQLSYHQNTATVPVAQLPNGVYYYHIRGLPSGKLIIQH